MATSISSQLQKIKSLIESDSESLKRPFTRPSILFSPKEAADIDIDTVYEIALSGLNVLVDNDGRFRNFKNDLFCHKSKDLDRELMTPAENDRINASINSFLRLLSGYLHLLSSHKTLEYLLRRYKVHVYNWEELILCALPFHDTHAFVQIVQLINFGNSKWKFLDGVKVTGAPPPKRFIVQQCVRDLGVLEDILNYASPSGKFQPSSNVLKFSTAVVVEALGSFAAVNSDIVKRIIPFVSSRIQPESKRNLEHRASALMIVGMLASKASLSPKFVNNLVRSLAQIAKEDTEAPTDSGWVRLSLMALINLIQLQPLEVFPTRALISLKETRDVTAILLGLSKEFNIDKFISLLLEALVEHSLSDETCYQFLISMVDSIPIGDIVDRIVSKFMFTCTKLSQQKGNIPSSEIGSCENNILAVIMKKYPTELQLALRRFVENKGRHSKVGEMGLGILSKLFVGNSDSPLHMIDAKVWFDLHHPKAKVRVAALTELNTSGILKAKTAGSKEFKSIQDVLLSQLRDDDLTVVLATLQLIGTLEAIDDVNLLQALHSVVRRCIRIFLSGSDDFATSGDIIMLCFKKMVERSNDSPDLPREIASMLFPLLFIMPKTRKYNFKALKLAKNLSWEFFQNLPDKKLESGNIQEMNQKIVDSLADAFFKHPQDCFPWLVESSREHMMSRTLFFLIIMQSFIINKRENDKLFELVETCFPVLKTQWEVLSSSGDMQVQTCNVKLSELSCTGFLDQLSGKDMKELNAEILICIFWKLLETLMSVAPMNCLIENETGIKLREFFTFLAGASPNVNHAFREHMNYLVSNYKSSPNLLSGIFTEDVADVIQVETLHCFAFLCAQSEDSFLLQLLAEAPSVLVPLASENQEVRYAAMICLEKLNGLVPRIDSFNKKNGSLSAFQENTGNVVIWSQFLEDLLKMLIQQKRLILSDKEFLPSFLTSLIGRSGHHNSILVPRNTEQWFNESTKEKILSFIVGSALKLSPHGKFMMLSLLKGLGRALLSVEGVDQLLSSLMKRCGEGYFEMDKSNYKLTKYEVDILCLLLESCATPSDGGCISMDYILDALRLPKSYSKDPAVFLPCIVVLNKLNNQIYSAMRSEVQELLLRELVLLARNPDGNVQNATKEALLRLEISSFVVARMLEQPSEVDISAAPQERKKKKAAGNKQQRTTIGENTLTFLGSILDILLMKKDISNRDNLICPLFKLLKEFSSEELGHVSKASDESSMQASYKTFETTAMKFCHIQQSIILVLDDIVISLGNAMKLKDEMLKQIDINLLLSCARSNEAGTFRRLVLSLLSSIAKVIPEKLFDHMAEVLTVVGESSAVEIDSQSQQIFESIISSIVPYWLSKSKHIEQLLKVFVNLLPEVPLQRGLSIILYVLRILGEHVGLGPLLSLLLRSLIIKKDVARHCNKIASYLEFLSVFEKEWEYCFAVQICEHYSSVVWLPALVMLLHRIDGGSLSREFFMEVLLAIHLVSQKLQDPELSMILDSGEHTDNIQGTLGEMMEHTVCLLHLVDANKKQLSVPSLLLKEFKGTMHSVLMSLTKAMTPTSFFSGMIKLLGSNDQEVRRKALGLLSKTLKIQDSDMSKQKGRRYNDTQESRKWVHLDGSALETFQQMSMDIVHLIDVQDSNSNISLKLSAVSAVEVLANKFPSDYAIFSSCLASITVNIGLDSIEFSSSCLRAAGALISVLGQKGLPHLPCLMENLIMISQKNTSRDILLSVLIGLEAVVDKLGSFLSPYLDKIGELLILQPALTSECDAKLKAKADGLRNLIIDRIPIRLTLPPLMKLYSRAVLSGDSSVDISFKMLGKLISSMDRPSIGEYHVKIFHFCLNALDIRRQHPSSIQGIQVIEQTVINCIISLTMKLTETMFKPLFVRTIEWAESEVDDSAQCGSDNTDRAISFYGLVNKLAENHRSLFVPYFKYLREGMIRHLTESSDALSSALTRKKKKPRVLEPEGKIISAPSHQKWHLNSLVVSAWHKCFLYDEGILNFLDSSNFQVLYKPIISQLRMEPPADLDDHPDLPSVEDVDDSLVKCIGQMAVTAGSDLLWKTLNHEVLMQTRSEKVRTRMVALRIIKYLVENLKEGYMIFLPETIPFLGELLEDVELPVKTLSQDILKEMESVSGESLQQYL